MNKIQLREKLIQRRNGLSKQDVNLKSLAITDSFLREVGTMIYGNVHIYSSHSGWNEVNTMQLMQRLAEIPIVDKVLSSPHSVTAKLPTARCNFIIVPVLGFDETCSRIGMGAGWYDRFLATQPNATTIGLAFESQKYDSVPMEPHDRKLDMIITEENIYIPPQ